MENKELTGKRKAASAGSQEVIGVKGRGIDLLMKGRKHIVTMRRRLRNNPTMPNESSKLELPRAWEPLGSSGPSPIGEREEAQFGFPHGNQIT
jgi:hypothetical protein